MPDETTVVTDTQEAITEGIAAGPAYAPPAAVAPEPTTTTTEPTTVTDALAVTSEPSAHEPPPAEPAPSLFSSGFTAAGCRDAALACMTTLDHVADSVQDHIHDRVQDGFTTARVDVPIPFAGLISDNLEAKGFKVNRSPSQFPDRLQLTINW